MDRRSDGSLRKRRLWRRSVDAVDGDPQRKTGVRGWLRREIGDFFHPESREKERGEKDREKEQTVVSSDIDDSYASVDIPFESCGDLR